MLPISPPHNVRHQGFADTKPRSQRSLRYGTGNIRLSNDPDVIFGQLSCANALTPNPAPPLISVGGVSRSRSFIQMSRSHTRGIVTVMASKQPAFDRRALKLHHNVRRSAIVEDSVSILVTRTCPDPTRAEFRTNDRAVLVNLRPEANGHRSCSRGALARPGTELASICSLQMRCEGYERRSALPTHSLHSRSIGGPAFHRAERLGIVPSIREHAPASRAGGSRARGDLSLATAGVTAKLRSLPPVALDEKPGSAHGTGKIEGHRVSPSLGVRPRSGDTDAGASLRQLYHMGSGERPLHGIR
jgi:hypothetical protein